MRGELIAVWPESWASIWEPLISSEGIPVDIFCELYRQLSEALLVAPTLEQLADIVDDQDQSREAFKAIAPTDLASERRLVEFFEEAHFIVGDLAGEAIAEFYVLLLTKFIEKYSLRYKLRAPCVLCPTLPGIFSALASDIQKASEGDDHLSSLLNEFDEALRDLRDDTSDGRIKTIIQKQMNLLEAFGATCAGVRSRQLGAICGELKSWPHSALRNSLSNLYGFASDYPGIRHAGSPKGALRSIGMKDLIALSVVLTGFTPYLRDNFDSGAVYWGGKE
ncbi:hypothetical protein FHW12_004066 [Dokdonella fugitiva]|uniref:Uncharacterized protein n=1 Tax=Dokdonella fugitiva TaxID=328517 RepID=A0A839F7V2_9GAMM|nr:hypothetical protein [Dokdonella fugitiva]MBA8889819.1 hypothetical protein [Dokdonella fugitiva]